MGKSSGVDKAPTRKSGARHENQTLHGSHSTEEHKKPMGTTCVIRERLDKSLRWVTLGFLYCFWQNKGAPSWKDKKVKVLEREKHLFVVLFYGVMSFQVRTSFPDNLQLCRWEFVCYSFWVTHSSRGYWVHSFLYMVPVCLLYHVIIVLWVMKRKFKFSDFAFQPVPFFFCRKKKLDRYLLDQGLWWLE